MQGPAFDDWWEQFLTQVQEPERAERLKQASLDEDLKAWTELTTSAVVRACRALGWDAAARGYPSRRLPQRGHEYLGIDVMAFPPVTTADVPWPLPLAVFELENQRRDERVAYSLWKVISVRSRLRVVLSYRPDWEQGRRLIQSLQDAMIGSLEPDDVRTLEGDTILIVGNRGEGETFPWGYFKRWRLNVNLGRFEKL